jgi:DNA-binding beta-propeller fold protein YncE
MIFRYYVYVNPANKSFNSRQLRLLIPVISLIFCSTILANCANRTVNIQTKTLAVYVVRNNSDQAYLLGVFHSTVGSPVNLGFPITQLVTSKDGLLIFAISSVSQKMGSFNTLSQALGNEISLPGKPIQFVLSPLRNSIYGYLLFRGMDVFYSINLLNYKLGSSYPGANDPTSMAINKTGVLALVTDAATNTLNVIDLFKRQVKIKIPVGKDPVSVALSPNGVIAYVACKNSDTVVPVNLETFKALPPIPVGVQPTQIIVDPLGYRAYVIGPNSPYVIPIDIIQDKVEKSIFVSGLPQYIIEVNNGSELLVSERSPDAIGTISTKYEKLTNMFFLPFDPSVIAAA